MSGCADEGAQINHDIHHLFCLLPSCTTTTATTMSSSVSPDLRRMTSQPTITLSAPAPLQSKSTSGKGPSSTSANATPKQTSPGPLLPSSGQPHAAPGRSQSIPSSPTSVYVKLPVHPSSSSLPSKLHDVTNLIDL